MKNKKPMNTAAQALGRLAKGIPKTLSAEQREAKRRILAANRARITPASNKARMAKAWATRRAKQAATHAARAARVAAMTTEETLADCDAVIQQWEKLLRKICKTAR